MNTPVSTSEPAPAVPATGDSPSKTTKPGVTAGEWLARFVVVVFAVIVGLIAALIIAYSVGWIHFDEC